MNIFEKGKTKTKLGKNIGKVENLENRVQLICDNLYEKRKNQNLCKTNG